MEAFQAWRTTAGLNAPATVEVVRSVEAEVRAVEKDFIELNHTLIRHEELIRKRWSKKSKNQRATLLVSAFPSGYGPMPTAHRPDLAAFKRIKMRRSDRQHQEIGMDKVQSKHMAAYMFPQLNLEDLCDGSLAMRLLYERGRNHPGYFARMEDLQRVRRCEAMGVLEGARMKVTPYLVNMTTDWNEYGKIVSMADFPLSEHAKGDKTGRWMLYEGLQVLQMQHHILSFLLALSKGILHDMPDPLAASYPELKHTVYPPDDTQGKWCAAAGLAVDSQYHTPGRIYLYRVHGRSGPGEAFRRPGPRLVLTGGSQVLCRLHHGVGRAFRGSRKPACYIQLGGCPWSAADRGRSSFQKGSLLGQNGTSSP